MFPGENMKKLLIMLMLITSLMAQEINVIENKAVTKYSDGEFFYPTVKNDIILFSTPNYSGLWMVESNGSIHKLTDENGAGLNPIINKSTDKIYYIEDKFISGRKVSNLVSVDIASKKKVIINENLKELKLIQNKNELGFIQSSACDDYKYSDYKELNANESIKTIVLIEYSDLVLLANGVRKVLRPLGKQNYIWPSVSPDGNRILFTCAGKGTYITDLNGKVLVDLGYANYPTWSPNGQWILYMNDKDDGIKLISSDIGIKKADGSKTFLLTSTKDKHEIYPSWGNDETELVYNTDEGVVFKMIIEIK